MVAVAASMAQAASTAFPPSTKILAPAVAAMGFERVMLNRFNVGGAGIAHRTALELSGPELRAVFRAASMALGRGD